MQQSLARGEEEIGAVWHYWSLLALQSDSKQQQRPHDRQSSQASHPPTLRVSGLLMRKGSLMPTMSSVGMPHVWLSQSLSLVIWSAGAGYRYRANSAVTNWTGRQPEEQHTHSPRRAQISTRPPPLPLPCSRSGHRAEHFRSHPAATASGSSAGAAAALDVTHKSVSHSGEHPSGCDHGCAPQSRAPCATAA